MTDISATTIDISAVTVDVSATTIDISATTIDVSATIIDVSAVQIVDLSAVSIPITTPTPSLVYYNTSLAIDKTITKKITSFGIGSVTVSPFKSAVVDLVFSYDTGESFTKPLLIDASYCDWKNDDNFLYEFAGQNIEFLLSQ